MNRPVERPNPALVLSGLKDFQRRTVEHVHRRFFDETDPARKFLVADEVGLGKTLIAKGVTTKLVDRLWDEVDRIDVVYICSNAAIATQNIARLQLSESASFTKATRLTLLPRVIHDLQHRKLNFISLTPGTSFSQHSATGTGEERALIYLMLREAWDLGSKKGPLNLFCHQMGRDSFKHTIDWIQDTSTIDQQLAHDFVEALEATDLRSQYDEAQEFFQRRQWDRAPEEGRRKQVRLIDRLRRVLARSCVDALEPDLVILDEFQRFQHLLRVDDEGNPTTDAGELAHQLFGYSDPETGEHARTLLLSATPYTAFGIDPDDPDSSHHEAFMETIAFLLDDPGSVAELRDLFNRQRDALLSQATGDSFDSSTSRRIREILLTCMCRTERLGATSDRDGMLKQFDHLDQEMQTEDVLGYVAAQEVAREVEVPDLIEFWKSSPYLLNMMDGYKFDRRLSKLIETGSTDGIAPHLRDGAPGVLDRNLIEELRPLDAGNARLRELWKGIEEAEAWKLLWLNPSMPYYEPSGPFATEGARRFTKRLVFSNWMVVPRAISTVLSYMAEQRLAEAGGHALRTYSEQGKTAGSLKTLFARGRVAPSFGLLYPSRTLAAAGDPLRFVTDEGCLPTAEFILDRLMDDFRALLAELPRPSNDIGLPDQAWYWAAPILLDLESDGSRTREFLEDMRAEDPADPSDEGDGEQQATQWERCLETAGALLDGSYDLGPQPEDLAEVLAAMSLGGFGNTAYRALARRGDHEPRLDSEFIRIDALRVALSLRALFNLPHSTHLLQALQTPGSNTGRDALWRESLDYCIAGNLQAVLDEFAHLIPEQRGLSGNADHEVVANRVADVMTEAIGLRTTNTSATFFDVGSNGEVATENKRLRTRFAIPFVTGQSDDAQDVERVEHVREAFNSPFWPFVLTSTSVGQEGLDFHLYCHAVVHWNLPSNPVDLEQREGRVHRYKNHAVRRNLAQEFAERALASNEPSGSDPWHRLFRFGVENRPEDQTELWPFWIFTPSNGTAFHIERHVMAMRLSRDEAKLRDLLKCLVLYRSVLGQPRQEDLVAALEGSSIEDLEKFSLKTRIDLSPAD